MSWIYLNKLRGYERYNGTFYLTYKIGGNSQPNPQHRLNGYQGNNQIMKKLSIHHVENWKDCEKYIKTELIGYWKAIFS
jgi:hypothetical protein